MKNPFLETKKFLEKYERVLMPGMLILGLIVDFFTFKTIRLETTFKLLVAHLVIVGISITFLAIHDSKLREKSFIVWRYFKLAAPFIIQFSFGALLSASFIFYWFSGSLSASWPLIVIIALLMVSNDALRHYYLSPLVQISVYFFVMFSISSLILPSLFNSIDAGVFLLGGVLSLTVILLYVFGLSKYLGTILQMRTKLIISIIAIFIMMNGLYFLNVIPPIPLSLREADVYHSVTRFSDGYLVTDENQSFLSNLSPIKTIHTTPGERIYVYSSIFAPTDLNLRIVHEWQKYNESAKEWQIRSMPSFPIFGGRDEGFRGYSFSNQVSPGKWKVLIKTEQDQILGRLRFNAVAATSELELVEINK